MGAQDDQRPRAAPVFAPQELAAEAVREAGMRRGVYPRLVRAGKMSQEMADRRIALMEAIARRLAAPAGRDG